MRVTCSSINCTASLARSGSMSCAATESASRYDSRLAPLAGGKKGGRGRLGREGQKRQPVTAVRLEGRVHRAAAH